jgi:methylase of polypeptide subunit release factors
VIIQTDKPLRERAEFDLYPTPIEAVKRYLDCIPLEELTYNPFNKLSVLDVGAGTGVWVDGLLDRVGLDCMNTYGVEYQEKFTAPYYYDYWFHDDFLKWESPTDFDLIIGNPPYGKDVTGKKDRKYAEKFIRKSWDLLKDGGFICFLLRLNFLEGKERGQKFWPKYKPRLVSVSTKRPSFTGDQKTDATAYAAFLWQKGFIGKTTLDWTDWEYEN